MERVIKGRSGPRSANTFIMRWEKPRMNPVLNFTARRERSLAPAEPLAFELRQVDDAIEYRVIHGILHDHGVNLAQFFFAFLPIERFPVVGQAA